MFHSVQVYLYVLQCSSYNAMARTSQDRGTDLVNVSEFSKLFPQVILT
jgi:hypothetical protein